MSFRKSHSDKSTIGERTMQFLRITILALTFMVSAQPVSAALISDGSSGIFRPIHDFTLDLSSLAAPQYSSIYVDAGIKLTVLTPTGGAFGDLLAANDIFINGIIDAGAGNLGLLAGNQIMMGVGSQVIAGSLYLRAGNLDLSGALVLKSAPTFDRLGRGLISGDITILPGADLTLSADATIPREVDLRIGGEINLRSGAIVTQAPTPALFQEPDPITLGFAVAVPEPSTVLLLLPGLMLLARGSWRRAL